MKNNILKTVTMIILAVMTSFLIYSQTKSEITVKEIVKKYTEAIGGEDVINKIVTRKISGVLITDLPTWNPPVYEVDTFKVFTTSSNKMILKTKNEKGEIFIEGYNGKNRWKQINNEIKIMDKNLFDAIPWVIDLKSLLLDPKYFNHLEYMGTEKTNNKNCYKISTGEGQTLYFDIETGLLHSLGNFIEIQKYHELDCIKIPSKVAYSRKGGSTTFFLNKIENNVEIDESIFELPKNK